MNKWCRTEHPNNHLRESSPNGAIICPLVVHFWEIVGLSKNRLEAVNRRYSRGIKKSRAYELEKYWK